MARRDESEVIQLGLQILRRSVRELVASSPDFVFGYVNVEDLLEVFRREIRDADVLAVVGSSMVRRTSSNKLFRAYVEKNSHEKLYVDIGVFVQRTTLMNEAGLFASEPQLFESQLRFLDHIDELVQGYGTILATMDLADEDAEFKRIGSRNLASVERECFGLTTGAFDERIATRLRRILSNISGFIFGRTESRASISNLTVPRLGAIVPPAVIEIEREDIQEATSIAAAVAAGIPIESVPSTRIIRPDFGSLLLPPPTVLAAAAEPVFEPEPEIDVEEEEAVSRPLPPIPKVVLDLDYMSLFSEEVWKRIFDQADRIEALDRRPARSDFKFTSDSFIVGNSCPKNTTQCPLKLAEIGMCGPQISEVNEKIGYLPTITTRNLSGGVELCVPDVEEFRDTKANRERHFVKFAIKKLADEVLA